MGNEYNRLIKMHDKCVKTSKKYKVGSPMFTFWIKASLGFLIKARNEITKELENGN